MIRAATAAIRRGRILARKSQKPAPNAQRKAGNSVRKRRNDSDHEGGQEFFWHRRDVGKKIFDIRCAEA